MRPGVPSPIKDAWLLMEPRWSTIGAPCHLLARRVVPAPTARRIAGLAGSVLKGHVLHLVLLVPGKKSEQHQTPGPIPDAARMKKRVQFASRLAAKYCSYWSWNCDFIPSRRA